MRLGLAQINPTVGDLEGNLGRIIGYAERAVAVGCDLVCFPELSLTGYPPEDLLLKPSFQEANLRSLGKLVEKTRGMEITVVVGYADYQPTGTYNAAAVIYRGSIYSVYHKIHLPNYGVFDEKRYFQSGDQGLVFECAGALVGVTICEDIWLPDGPAVAETLQGLAKVILNLSASPYHRGKQRERESMLSDRAVQNTACVAYVNQVGAQDELVYDGNSVVFDHTGRLVAKAVAFEEDLLVADLRPGEVREARKTDPDNKRQKEYIEMPGGVKRVSVSPASERVYPPLAERSRSAAEPGEEAEVLAALVLGVRDYFRKTGFSRALVGLSGGIDSSLTVAIAVMALGRESVTGVLMPSPYTSLDSREDAEEMARNLGIRFETIPISGIFESYLATLEDFLQGPGRDLAVQNIQARIRGNLLMALANKDNSVVLTTGNKSELSVGYATLYGDLAGGFAVLKDVPKTLVYRLSDHYNQASGRMVIPQRVMEKAPTAELKPDQRDEDDLPPYPLLDQVIELYVEQNLTVPEIVGQGFDLGLVRRVVNMIDRNEYKRRQGPPGVKITHRAYGRDRRMPIANRFREG